MPRGKAAVHREIKYILYFPIDFDLFMIKIASKFAYRGNYVTVQLY